LLQLDAHKKTGDKLKPGGAFFIAPHPTPEEERCLEVRVQLLERLWMLLLRHRVGVTLYDNTAGSGKVVAKMIVPGANFHGEALFPQPIAFSTGLYAVVAGTGAAAIIYYA